MKLLSKMVFLSAVYEEEKFWNPFPAESWTALRPVAGLSLPSFHTNGRIVKSTGRNACRPLSARQAGALPSDSQLSATPLPFS